MEPALFSDFAQRFRSEISMLNADTASYQTFDLAMELLVERTLVSFAMKRRKGVNDSLFYRRDLKTGNGAQISQDVAFRLFDHFLTLPQHLALIVGERELKADGFAEAVTIDWQFPTCAVEYMFRKRGVPKAVSTRMLLVGCNDKTETEAYARTSARSNWIVTERPFDSATFWEFR